MADHQYPCPKCAAVLKPPKAINPGQKVKCPKCQNVFIPVPEAGAEEEEAMTYGIVQESDEEKKAEVEVKRKALEKTQDRRPKSARGPAVAKCTGPGNRMIATASITCVSCIFSIVVLMWPMFFSKQVLTDKPERWMTIAAAVFAFVYNGFIAYSAVQMLSIESYRWAMMGSIMNVFPLQFALSAAAFNWLVKAINIGADPAGWLIAIPFGLVYLFVGFTCLQTLRNKEVVAGFTERKPGDI
jgi:hypothetical protein